MQPRTISGSGATSPNYSEINAVLSTLILPWAKASHPDKYEMTLKVARSPESFNAYLIRLIEIRATEDSEWRKSLPLSVLDLTGLKISVRDPSTGLSMTFSGRKVKGRENAISELGLTKESFRSLQEAKSILDLEYVDD